MGTSLTQIHGVVRTHHSLRISFLDGTAKGGEVRVAQGIVADVDADIVSRPVAVRLLQENASLFESSLWLSRACLDK